MNILIIKTTSLGDVLHATLSIKAIKKTWPEARITWVLDRGSSDIIDANPGIDRILYYDNKWLSSNWYRHPLKCISFIRSLVRSIRKTHYDIAFDLQGLSRSVFFLYRARADKKYVKGNWVGLPGYKNSKIHATEEIRRVLELGGVDTSGSIMDFYLTPEDKTEADRFISENNPSGKKLIAVSPFTRWRTKDWPLVKFRELISCLDERHLVCLTGAPGDKDKIASLAAVETKAAVLNLAGRFSLRQFAGFLSHTDVLLGCDSFPMHLACALGIPVVALFGPTNEIKVGPVGDKAVVLRDTSICTKCYSRHCRKGCMEKISVDDVYKALIKILN